MRKLHPTQSLLLQLLRTNSDRPLTMRELQTELDISSTSVVHHHVAQLEKKGYLRRNPSNPQDYQVLDDQPDVRIAHIQLFGLAKCGPGGRLLDGSPVDTISLSTEMLGFDSSLAFAVKAHGDSMLPRIHSGDLILARKQTSAKEGDTVVCVNEGEVLVKVLRKHKESVLLQSINQDYPPFPADPTSFAVEGVVRMVMSYV